MTYRIEAIDRLNNSVNGNPRFQFRLGFTDPSDHRLFCVVRSQSDAAFCYEVGNPGFRVGDEVDVTWTKAGRVARMRSV